MLKRIVLVVVIAAVLAGLFVPWMEIPNVNPHEGAVAFSKVTLITHSLPLGNDGKTATYTFSADPATVPAVGHIDAAFPIEQYHAPAPTMKSPFDRYFGTAFTRPEQLVPGDTPGDTSGSTCTSATTEVTIKKTFTAKITASQPDATKLEWKGSKTVDLPVNKIVKTCVGSNTVTTTTWSETKNVKITWEIGTFYYTHGVGKYNFKIDLIDSSAANAPVTISTRNIDVIVPGDWTGK
jgi:hypothetical protein